nr:MAG TPA: hypothetical protein [Caudoviricetes sp.]
MYINSKLTYNIDIHKTSCVTLVAICIMVCE